MSKITLFAQSIGKLDLMKFKKLITSNIDITYLTSNQIISKYLLISQSVTLLANWRYSHSRVCVK